MNIWKSTSKTKTTTTVSKPKYFAGCSRDGFYNGVWKINSCETVNAKISKVRATMINGCWSATFDANGNLVKWPYNRTHGKPPKGKVLFILNKKQTGELDRIIGKKDFVVIYGKAYDYVKNLVAKKYPKRIEMF